MYKTISDIMACISISVIGLLLGNKFGYQVGVSALLILLLIFKPGQEVK